MDDNVTSVQSEIQVDTEALILGRLDEILRRLDSRVALVCPLCGNRVEYSQATRLDPGVTTVACSACCGYFIVEVRKIDDSA